MHFIIFIKLHYLIWLDYNIKTTKSCADPEGGTGGPDPPWDLSEVGSCVDIWWVGEGVQMLFSSYFYRFFWLAPLASIIHSENIWKIRITSKFEIVIRSPVMHTIAGFHESAISIFILSKNTILHHLNPQFSGGGPPAPPPHCDINYTFYKA